MLPIDRASDRTAPPPPPHLVRLHRVELQPPAVVPHQQLLLSNLRLRPRRQLLLLHLHTRRVVGGEPVVVIEFREEEEVRREHEIEIVVAGAAGR